MLEMLFLIWLWMVLALLKSSNVATKEMPIINNRQGISEQIRRMAQGPLPDS